MQYAQDSNSNILSTPSILAMDNELATSIIGQEIPITTGESLGTNNCKSHLEPHQDKRLVLSLK